MPFNEREFHSVQIKIRAVPLHYVTQGALRVISVLRVDHNVHAIATWPRGRVSWGQLTGDHGKSQTALVNIDGKEKNTFPRESCQKEANPFLRFEKPMVDPGLMQLVCFVPGYLSSFTLCSSFLSTSIFVFLPSFVPGHLYLFQVPLPEAGK